MVAGELRPWPSTAWLAARWVAVALPVSFLLLAVALIAIALWTGAGLPPAEESRLEEALALWCAEVAGSIALWCVAARYWPGAEASWSRLLAGFPIAVAAVGIGYVAAVGGDWTPISRGGWAAAVAVSAWLGFSWTLVAARALLPGARPRAAPGAR